MQAGMFSLPIKILETLWVANKHLRTCLWEVFNAEVCDALNIYLKSYH